MPVTPKSFVALDFEEALATVRGGPQASAFYALPTPAELNAIYSRGFQGIRKDRETPEERAAFRDFVAAQPRLYDVFSWAKGLGKNKIIAPWVAMKHFDSEWGGRDAQARGDCTVHGTRNACSMDYGCDALMGETKFLGSLAVENIYRSRGFNGDGWSCESPCAYVGPEGKGGLLYRKVYSNGSDSVDLSKYNPSWEGNGKAGVPTWMEEESRKNKVKWVIPISNEDEYFDALAMGFGINVCSGQGFSSTTDENGVARAQGSWSHSMAHVGGITTQWAISKYGGPIGAIQQSWGNWNTINGKPEGAPASAVGMFYSKFATVASMLRGQDSFAMVGVKGWERGIWDEVTREGLLNHLRGSTAQDYYKTRQEQLDELTQQAVDERWFIAV